jgi:hypothetical protein
MAGVTRRSLLPWAGVLGGATGWFVSQQSGSSMVFAHCADDRGLGVGLLGLLGIALAIGGGLLSYRSWRAEHEAESGRQFVGLLGMLIAALFAFPIAMQTVAAFLVPGCLS